MATLRLPICGLLLLGLAAACARSGPPAPVEYATPPISLPTNVAGNAVNVAEGDTVFAIARRHAVPVRDLILANGLAPPYRLEVGRSLIVPATQTHLVQPGETIYSVSRRYGIDMTEVARANGIESPFALQTGMRLKVPRQASPSGVEPAVARAPPPAGPKPVTPAAPSGAVTVAALPPPPEEKPTPAPMPGAEQPPSAQETQAARIAPPPAAVGPPPPRKGQSFLWPVQGKLLSRYGPKPGGLQNDGINIAAPRGAAIRAAESGVVVYAGNELRGFGNLLLIRHADGWVSAYAHSEELLVARGQQVTRGQTIAKVGSTGNVTEPQLHFELRQGVNAVDPIRYLAKGADKGSRGTTLSSADAPAGRPDPG